MLEPIEQNLASTLLMTCSYVLPSIRSVSNCSNVIPSGISSYDLRPSLASMCLSAIAFTCFDIFFMLIVSVNLHTERF